MIEKKTHKLKISLAEAKKKESYKKGDSIYDTQNGEFSFSANYATGKKFRLVHDGKKAFVIVEGTDKTVTSTIYTIEEFDTEEQALKQIEKLGLEYDPPEKMGKFFLALN